MADWSEKFNTLAENKLEVEGNKEWRFAIEESKSKGNLQLNAREFKISESYSGPMKNGFIYQINSIEDVQMLKEAFNTMFEEAEKLFQ